MPKSSTTPMQMQAQNTGYPHQQMGVTITDPTSGRGRQVEPRVADVDPTAGRKGLAQVQAQV